MRLIAVLLLVANLCLAAYAQLDLLGHQPDPAFAPEKPERIRLLTPQQVAALGPSKIAQLNLSCAEWGPFTDRERTAVQPVLDALQLGKTIAAQKVEMPKGFWVFIPSKNNKTNMDKAIKELDGLGVTDIAQATDGNDKPYAISLGVYRSEELALARLKELEDKGVKTAKVEPRDTPINGTLYVIREPQQATVAALEEAKSKFPSAELKFLNCRDRVALVALTPRA